MSIVRKADDAYCGASVTTYERDIDNSEDVLCAGTVFHPLLYKTLLKFSMIVSL